MYHTVTIPEMMIKALGGSERPWAYHRRRLSWLPARSPQTPSREGRDSHQPRGIGPARRFRWARKRSGTTTGVTVSQRPAGKRLWPPGKGAPSWRGPKSQKAALPGFPGEGGLWEPRTGIIGRGPGTPQAPLDRHGSEPQFDHQKTVDSPPLAVKAVEKKRSRRGLRRALTG